jgi:uncharacterized protein YciI
MRNLVAIIQIGGGKMKRAAIAVLLLSLFFVFAGARPGIQKENPEMMTYYVGLLFRGPAWTPDETPEVRALQEGHMANIRRLAVAGKLILAGPFTDDGKLRGMFVFKVASLEEARSLCDTDPAVKAGRLVVELHPWYSVKGIQVIQ